MTKKITSYDDLLKERQRLELLLEAQKEIIYGDIEQIKEELQPVRHFLSFLKKITTRDRTSFLLSLGSDIAINSLVKNFVLSKAGWLARMIVPFFLKNYSSHVLTEQKDKWVEKLKDWISGHRNGREHKEDDSYAGKEDKTGPSQG